MASGKDSRRGKEHQPLALYPFGEEIVFDVQSLVKMASQEKNISNC